MRKSIIILFVLFVNFIAMGQTANNYFQEGLDKLSSKNYRIARAKFTKAIELNPNYSDAYLGRGNSKYNLKSYQSAILDYTKAIDLNTNSFESYFARGKAYKELKEFKLANIDFTKAIELKPNSSDSYFERRETYGDDDKFGWGWSNDFNKYLDLEIERNPTNAELYYKKALYYSLPYEYKIEEIFDYTRAIEFNPNYIEAYKGLIYSKWLQIEDIHGAIQECTKLIGIDPKNSKKYYEKRAEFEEYLENYEEALKDYKRNSSKYKVKKAEFKYLTKDYIGAIEEYNKLIESGFKYGYLNRGLAKEKLKDNNGAIEDYNLAIEWMNSDAPKKGIRNYYHRYDINDKAEVYQLRANCKNKIHDLQGSEKDYLAIFNLWNDTKFNKNSGHGFWHRGRAKLKSEDYQGAILDFNECTKFKNEIFVYLDRGLAKKMLKDYEGALADYLKFKEVFPKLNYMYYEQMGDLKFELNDFKAALEYYEKNINPGGYTNVEAYLRRGKVKDALKNYEGAILDYTKYLERFPFRMECYLLRGIAKNNIADFKGAILDFNKAIKLEPKNSNAYFRRALTKKNIDNNAYFALSDLSISIALNPNENSTYYERGLVKLELKDNEGACADFLKAKELGNDKAVEMINENCTKK